MQLIKIYGSNLCLNSSSVRFVAFIRVRRLYCILGKINKNKKNKFLGNKRLKSINISFYIVSWTLAWREILGLAQVDGTGLASLDEISPTVIPVVARKNAPDWVSSGSRIEGLWQFIEEIGIYFIAYLGVSSDFSWQCSCW